MSADSISGSTEKDNPDAKELIWIADTLAKVIKWYAKRNTQTICGSVLQMSKDIVLVPVGIYCPKGKIKANVGVVLSKGDECIRDSFAAMNRTLESGVAFCLVFHAYAKKTAAPSLHQLFENKPYVAVYFENSESKQRCNFDITSELDTLKNYKSLLKGMPLEPHTVTKKFDLDDGKHLIGICSIENKSRAEATFNMYTGSKKNVRESKEPYLKWLSSEASEIYDELQKKDPEAIGISVENCSSNAVLVGDNIYQPGGKSWADHVGWLHPFGRVITPGDRCVGSIFRHSKVDHREQTREHFLIELEFGQDADQIDPVRIVLMYSPYHEKSERHPGRVAVINARSVAETAKLDYSLFKKMYGDNPNNIIRLEGGSPGQNEFFMHASVTNQAGGLDTVRIQFFDKDFRH